MSPMEEMEEMFDKLSALLEDNNYRELKHLLSEMNEVDIAMFMDRVKLNRVTTIFRTLPKDLAADVFPSLSPDIQERIVKDISDTELKEVIDELFVDDAVDLLEELPAYLVKRVLTNAAPDHRAQLNQFLQYPENSAGSIMTAEFVDLHSNMTVKDAFLRIRRTGIDKETVYTCYVIDEARRLLGVVPVRSLLLSDEDTPLTKIMETDIISVTTTDDQEEVARTFSKYGFMTIPVVDNENRLVGIVTIDDVVEVIEEEATEDFERMAAMLPSERPYLKTSIFTLAKNRIGWLLVLMVSAMVTGAVLEKFEAAFAAIPLLVTFIPMLTDTGGNAGGQSSTLIIRGMALGEVSGKDAGKIFFKELCVSLIVGAVLSVVNYIRLLIMYPGEQIVTFTVAVSLFATVVLAKTVGGLLPIAAKKLKADPAIMAAPMVTTIVDAFSLVIYFTIAQKLLGL